MEVLKAFLLGLNIIILSVGQVGSPILTRLYFLHGGKRRWLTSWLLTAAFPLMIFRFAPLYLSKTRIQILPRKLVMVSALLGSILSLFSYLYSFGMSYLPVSISSLLSTSQLAFTAVFAYLLVKQNFTPYSINAVVLMTFGSIVLGSHMDGDRPEGVSSSKYLLGFFMTIAGAALQGFFMPLMEFAQKKAGGYSMTTDMVMQFQLLIMMFSNLFCTIPMLINNDFQAIPREAADYGLGKTKYYMILIFTAVAKQFNVIGSFGVMQHSSSLLGGILTSLLVPVQQVFAVILLPESFNVDKAISLAMCVCGFASYLYGEYKRSHQKVDDAKQLDKQEIEVV